MSSNEGGALTKGGRGRSKASKAVSRSQKAGLQFPVGQGSKVLDAEAHPACSEERRGVREAAGVSYHCEWRSFA
ncbi:hypothetical protein OIU77_018609 [Salix suchowensis]|uniref:Uncharacterized protein n=1 Tax=Salix suchowensis TaxID=1278906 RepID=A0ABQ9CGY3_9ROSI|nr:hypothetical protein OIU77_018609 [Salix suchowensis]